MAEHTVVVVGSNQPFPEYTAGNFWVIDFSNAATPTAVSVPCASSGVVLDCSGMQAAVASVAGDTVTIYEIATPATPSSIGSASLSLTASARSLSTADTCWSARPATIAGRESP